MGVEKKLINMFGVYIEEIVFLLILEALLAVIFLIGWFWYNKNRFTAYVCEPYLNTYKIKKKFRISMVDTDFKWNNKAYKIDFKNAISDEKNKPLLYYNYVSAKPIIPLSNMGMKETDKVIDSKTFKIGLDGDVIRHLSSRRLEKMFWYVIIGLVFVILIIGVYSIYSMSLSNDKILILTNRLLNYTKSITNKPIIIP